MRYIRTSPTGAQAQASASPTRTSPKNANTEKDDQEEEEEGDKNGNDEIENDETDVDEWLFEQSKRGYEDLIESIVNDIHQYSAVLRGRDLYAIGVALVAVMDVWPPPPPLVSNAYQELLSTLSINLRQTWFDTVLRGLKQFIHQTIQKDWSRKSSKDLILPLSAVAALYQASPLAGVPIATVVTPTTTNLFQQEEDNTTFSLLLELVQLYYWDKSKDEQEGKIARSAIRHAVLVLTGCLLLLGDCAVFITLAEQRDCNQLLTVLQALQQHEQESGDGLWNDLCKYFDQQHSWWRERIIHKLKNTTNQDNDKTTTTTAVAVDSAQPEYLISLFSTPAESPEKTTTSWKDVGDDIQASQKLKTEPMLVVVDPLQPLLDQIRAVFPNLGEGFCELALQLYHFNVEEAVSALLLLDTSEALHRLPTPLLVADRSLPRKPISNTPQQLQKEEMEAKQVTKTSVLVRQEQEQKELALFHKVLTTTTTSSSPSLKIDEYNDDYDDQWDEDDPVTTMDTGLYDAEDDRQAILTYNRLYREMENEEQFWNDMKNTNREQEPPPTTIPAAKTVNKTGRGRGGAKSNGGRGVGVNNNASGGGRGGVNNSGGGGGGGRGVVNGGSVGSGRGNVNGSGGGGRGVVNSNGRGRGRGGAKSNNTNDLPTKNGLATVVSLDPKPETTGRGRGGAKDRMLAKRRSQQKKAMIQKSGGGA